jgi:hypothetical protein
MTAHTGGGGAAVVRGGPCRWSITQRWGLKALRPAAATIPTSNSGGLGP